MNQISLLSSLEFLDYFLNGILNRGLLEPLDSYAKTSFGPLSQACRSAHMELLSGKTLHEAFRDAKPSFPPPVQEIIRLGEKASALDVILKESLDALKLNSESEEKAHEALGLLIDKWQNQGDPKIACSDCLQREARKVLLRAKTEGAKVVTLSQADENFMVQKFHAVKLVQVREAQRPFVMRTLEQELRNLAQSGRELCFDNERWRVESNGQGAFELGAGGQNITLHFEEHSGNEKA